MIGFYDGISHPVLGLDHFLAMVSVGIISSQIGGRAIWTVPATFVLIMIIGGITGIALELNAIANENSTRLSEINQNSSYADYLYPFIEVGILISVIVLGLSIAINKKISTLIVMIFVGIFGFFHGSAHGLEMPQAVNPILFALGFATGTTILHLFGVIIGYMFIQNNILSIILRIIGLLFSIFGFYSLFFFFN